MIEYHLDADIAIYILNRRAPIVLARFAAADSTLLAISTIAISELEFGAAHSSRPLENRARLQAFLQPLHIETFTQAAATAYGRLRHDLTRRGELIGEMDMLIAAVALANNATLITNNVREFARVPGLRVENWAI